MSDVPLDPQVELAVERMFNRFKEYLDGKLTEFSAVHPTVQVCAMQHAALQTAAIDQRREIEKTRVAMDLSVEKTRAALESTVDKTRIALESSAESTRLEIEKTHDALAVRVSDQEKGQRSLLIKVTLIIGGIAAAQVIISFLVASGKL